MRDMQRSTDRTQRNRSGLPSNPAQAQSERRAPSKASTSSTPELLQPFELSEEPAPRSKLDELTFAHWRRAGVTPARPCSDAVFLRRAYLDLIGTLPSTEEARAFLLDTSPDKRTRLLDALLARPEYASYWSLRWGDVLRIKSEFPINLWPNAVQAYHRWVYAAMQSNMPYDRFARAMLTATGSNFRVPEVNFWRAVQSRDPESLARAVALTFLGVRAERWPRQRLQGMAAFFAKVAYKKTLEWKEEIVYFDPRLEAPSLRGVAPTFPDGKPARIPPGTDPRVVFADWLLAPGNPWCAKSAVNRYWYWLFGRGIVHEADDIRPDNPPCNPALLAYLEKEFIASGYDVRKLLRLITASATYQLSSVPRGKRTAGDTCFASYPLRRLEAEVLIDAIDQVTGSTESYSSPIPEPFTFVPESQRTIALADGSITSSFLDLFGRPARDNGYLSERNPAPSAAQRLHMINSSHIQRKLEQSVVLRGILRGRLPRQVVTQLYLTILSRFPTNGEMATALEYLRTSGLNGGLDLAWALLNSAEFTYRH